MSDLRRIVRDVQRIAARSSKLPAATALTLAHRLPVLCATSPSAWQQAELWRMSLEKPLVLGAVWTALALAPLQGWLALARACGAQGGAMLPLELAALGSAAMSEAVGTVHRRVTGNARRLSRRQRQGTKHRR